MRTFWSPNVGGHQQPLKRVTFSPSQKGHKLAELPGTTWFSSVGFIMFRQTHHRSRLSMVVFRPKFGWGRKHHVEMMMHFCKRISVKKKLGGGNLNIFYVHPILREMIQFDLRIFSNGLVQPPTRKSKNMITGWRKFVMRKFVLLGCPVGFVRINAWLGSIGSFTYP